MIEKSFEIELRGFNKEEVSAYIRELQEDYERKLGRAEEENRLLASQVEELKQRVEFKEQQRAQLEKDIETKYKTYIDNYDKIAGLVYESQLKSDEILKEAHENEDRILREADLEAKRRVEAVHSEVEQAMADGQTRYRDVRAQIRELVETLSEAQKKFEKGAAEVHEILDGMAGEIDETTRVEGTAPYEPALPSKAVEEVSADAGELPADPDTDFDEDLDDEDLSALDGLEPHYFHAD